MGRAFPQDVRRFLTLLLTFCWGPLQGATLERLSLDDMIVKSTAIVRARVLGSYSAFQGPIIYTHYRIHVTEQLKGRAASDVMVPGGTARGLRQAFAGAPQLAEGGDYVLFLWTGKTGTHIIGLTQGLFHIPPASSSGKAFAVRAASTEVMLEPGTGQAVRDERLVMKLSDLKARIATTLGSGERQ